MLYDLEVQNEVHKCRNVHGPLLPTSKQHQRVTFNTYSNSTKWPSSPLKTYNADPLKRIEMNRTLLQKGILSQYASPSKAKNQTKHYYITRLKTESFIRISTTSEIDCFLSLVNFLKVYVKPENTFTLYEYFVDNND